jgi:hypothetical protein
VPNPRDHLFAEEAHRGLNHVIGHRAKLSGRHEVLVRLKTGFDREKFDFRPISAAFRKDSERVRSTLKP